VDSSGVGYTTTMFVVMNKEKWKALPKDLQDIFTAVSKEFAVKHGEAWDQADKEGREYITQLKRTVITLPEAEQQRWKAAVQPVLDSYLSKAKEKNLPGEAFLKDVQAGIAQK
jgi:TRAP-type C4-dicarboxylate transport system substrate-binding protein